jgi:hypothetical protein
MFLLSIGILVSSNIVFPLVSLCLVLIMLRNLPRKFFKCGTAGVLAYFFDCLNCIEANHLFEIISFVCAMYVCVQMIKNINNNNKDDDQGNNRKRKAVFASRTQFMEQLIYKPQVVKA